MHSSWNVFRGDAERSPAIIGVVGLDVPFELIRAAGFQPRRLQGNPNRSSPNADRLLGKRVDPQIRSLAESLLEQDGSGLAGLLISHDNHSHLRLFAVLRALRTRDASKLPPIHFCDLLHSSDAACERYNRTRLLELSALLSQWAEEPIEDAALCAEIQAANQRRAELRGVSVLRRTSPPSRSGSQTLAVLSSAWTDQLRKLPPAIRGNDLRRIFLTGSSHDHSLVYTAIEAAGCVIVGEDHDWGDGGIDFDLNEQMTPMDSFLVRLALAPPTSAKSSIARRTAYVVSAAVNTGADAVVAYVRDGDAGPRWDVADQRLALAAAGIPLLLLDDQPYRIESTEKITAAVAAFLQASFK